MPPWPSAERERERELHMDMLARVAEVGYLSKGGYRRYAPGRPGGPTPASHPRTRTSPAPAHPCRSPAMAAFTSLSASPVAPGATTAGRAQWLPPPRPAVPASAAWRAHAAPDRAAAVALPVTGALASDANVPEGHKGLHSFLYGEDGAEVHSATALEYTPRKGEDDGSSLVPVGEYLEARRNEKLTGVYGLFDSKREIQYVGYGRNLIARIRGHWTRVGEERCSYVRAMVFANRAMASRTLLVEQADNWLREAGTIPPGNGVQRTDWEGLPQPTAETVEVVEHEERALKMRKAMGENLADGVAGETQSAANRRLNLLRAVEGDNWSSVIDGQTSDTIDPTLVEARMKAALHPIATPFSQASVHRSIGNEEFVEVEMSVAAVEQALDDVRPYLIADGGNVEVAEISDGIVRLRLQGACGSCPSSSATMKMGIERCLKGHFGEALKGVESVDSLDLKATASSVDSHLDILRPAILSYGATVKVMDVAGGKCIIHFTGPAPIGKGVQAAVKDKFPDIRTVELVS